MRRCRTGYGFALRLRDSAWQATRYDFALLRERMTTCDVHSA